MTMKEELFISFCKERNLSPGSVNVYHNALTHYTTTNGMTLRELLDEAIQEEDDKIPWRKRTLLSRLIDFRNYLIETGYTSTKNLSRVLTFYRHHYIEINSLPRNNFKKISEVKIPTKEDLQSAINIGDTLIKGFIPFAVETGLSKVDILKLTVGDFIKVTYVYHQETDIYAALQKLVLIEEDAVVTFYVMRTKTKKYHYTFAGTEAIIETAYYLLSRKDCLKEDSPLFKISYHWLTVKFEELNEELGLGVTEGNNYDILRCHTLRKYHATTLRNDGLSIDVVNSLQGKAKNKVDEAYFIDTPEELKEKYKDHMGSLFINMELRTIKSIDYKKIQEEVEEKDKILKEYGQILENIDKRLNSLESTAETPITADEFEDLFSR